MAKRKTVSISRKPSTVPPTTQSEAPPAPDRPLMAMMEALGDAPRERFAPPAAGVVGRAVYGTVFYVSYGVVFSVLLVGKLIPGSGLIGRGLRDGAAAAQSDFERPAPAEAPGSAGVAA